MALQAHSFTTNYTTSQMKDLWGTGSSWENCAFFDFDGNVIQGIDFMGHAYQKP